MSYKIGVEYMQDAFRQATEMSRRASDADKARVIEKSMKTGAVVTAVAALVIGAGIAVFSAFLVPAGTVLLSGLGVAGLVGGGLMAAAGLGATVDAAQETGFDKRVVAFCRKWLAPLRKTAKKDAPVRRPDMQPAEDAGFNVGGITAPFNDNRKKTEQAPEPEKPGVDQTPRTGTSPQP